VDIRFDPFLQGVAKTVVRGDRPKHLNWSMLDHASLVCTRTRPQCSTCVLSDRCAAVRNRWTETVQ
jgi:adenine-specific DNA glycosylase